MRMPHPLPVVAASFRARLRHAEADQKNCSYEQRCPAWTGGHGVVP